MLQPTYTEGELRLLEAADLVEHSATYNQCAFFIPFCKTPGCVLGHYAARHPEDFSIIDGVPYVRGTEFRSENVYHSVAAYFGITTDEAYELFSVFDCGAVERIGCRMNGLSHDSKSDIYSAEVCNAPAAAVYIRAFVARHFAARLAASEVWV